MNKDLNFTSRNYRVEGYYYGYEYLDENRNRWYQYPNCGAMTVGDGNCSVLVERCW